jgi:glycosyltransferase involved in cell wall biosynthesis
VTSCLSPRYGGPAALALELSAWLAQQGHDVTLVSTDADYPRGRLSDEEMAAQRQGAHEVRHFPVDVEPILYSARLRRFLRDEVGRHDVVHIHGLYRAPQSMAAHYARRAEVPYVLRPHGSLDPFLYNRSQNRWKKRLFEALVERRNWGAAAAMHYTSATERDQAACLGIDTCAVVIPHGVAPPEAPGTRGAFRSSVGVSDGAPLILYLGRLHQKKGVDVLIDAFHRVLMKLPEAELAIVGPDGDGSWPALAERAHSLGVAKRTHRVEYLGAPAKYGALSDADVFVLPSRGENYARAAVEAMGSGTPVVLTKGVNIWEKVVDAGAGVACNGDAQSVSVAILAVLTDHERRHSMGLAGPRFMRDHYGWDEVGRHVLSLYSGLVR